MSRVQLALNVSNIDEAVEFYRRLFGAEPAKRRPGYAEYIERTSAMRRPATISAAARPIASAIHQ